MRIDPELADVVAALPPTDLDDVAGARAMLDSLVGGLSPAPDERVTTRQAVVPGSGDQPDVPVLVFEPRSRPAAPVPGILHIHGGGFVLGSAAMEAPGAERLAGELGAVVVSVDYRLAPEHPFPAGVEDCYRALEWTAEQAGALGLDPDRLAVLGASAGGGLSAAVALLARDRGGPPLCFQFLGIPELDHRLETPSMRAYVDSPLWNRPAAVRSWQYYLGEGGGEVSPYASPALAGDLSGLPPAYVSVAQYDPLRDEGIEYARRLAQADVPVELHLFPGTFHGSILVEGAWVSRRQLQEMTAVLRRALGLEDAR